MQPITLRNPETKEEKTFQVPTEFHELTQDQYLGAVAIMNNVGERPELQWALIPLIMKIPMEDLRTLNEVQRVQLLSHLEFLFDPDKLPYQCMVKSFSTLQYKMPFLSNKVTRAFSAILYGPGDGLSYLSFAEFMAAEQRLEVYHKNPLKNIESLNEFCGILYRKASKQRMKEDDKREGFREGQITANGLIFDKVTADMKSAILLNYQGAKALFPKLYKNLFPSHLQENGTEEPTDQPKPKKSNSLTWLNILFDMSNLDVEKIEANERAKLHKALKIIDETMVRNQKMRDEAKRQQQR